VFDGCECGAEHECIVRDLVVTAAAEGERIFKFSPPPSGLVVVLDTHGIDPCGIHIQNAEASERTCCVVEVHNIMNCVRIVLGVLDSLNIVLRTELGNKRRVPSAEANRAGAAGLTVRNTNPTGIENAVHERGAVDDVSRNIEQNRGRHCRNRIRGRCLEVEVDRTGGGGVL